MNAPAGGGSARVAVSTSGWARGVAPAPEVAAPTPAEEGTVQRDSRNRLSVWRSRLSWIGNGVIALLVGVMVGPGRRAGAGGVWWLGLALVFASALALEAVLIPAVFPALLRGATVSQGAALGLVLMGLPVRREWPLEVPAPVEEPAWPWSVPGPGRRQADEPAEEPVPAQEPVPSEVPA